MDVAVILLLLLSYVVTFLLGYSLGAHVWARHRHHH
jgi:hypothetical protein